MKLHPKSVSAVIIDDEYFNRELVSILIQRFKPAFNIIGTASNVREGHQLIETTKPDVIFLDIKMPDGSGFDLLKRIENIDFEVVFVSGFDIYTIKAFEFNALDYVLKPIDLDKFMETLDRIENRLSSDVKRPVQKILETINPSEAVISSIPIQHQGEMLLVDLKEVLYFLEKDDITTIITKPANRYISSKQLADFEFILEKFSNFVKVNEYSCININFISSYSMGHECLVTLTNGDTIQVSEKKKNEILTLFEKNIPGKAER